MLRWIRGYMIKLLMMENMRNEVINNMGMIQHEAFVITGWGSRANEEIKGQGN